MNTTTPFFARFWFIPAALLVAALVGVSWENYQYARENPGGNDFLVHWVGTRALLIDGISPYSDEVAEEIQTRAYGRPALPGEHQLRVAYPLYGEVLFLPFALISDYTLARAVWMTLLEAGLLLLAYFCLRLTGWKPPVWLLAAFLIFSLVWYHGLRPLINGNVVILAAGLLAGAFLALRTGRDELAGALLALATVKPQVVLLPILFVLVWTVSQGRWRALVWLVITLGLLSGGAALFLPNWPLQNLREILLYPTYNPPGTPGAAFSQWWPAAGDKLGWALSALLALLLLGEWLAARRKEFRWFLWTAGLTLAAGQWIGIQTDPGNYIILLIPLTLIFAVWEERWQLRGRLVVGLIMLLLLAGLWAIFLATVEPSNGQPLQHPIMIFPLPAFVLVGLYWIRWWAIRPARLLVEALRDYEN